MRWDMEILSPSSYFSNSSWSTKKWTAAENKAFENALALFDENTPDRWQRVAEMVPGKTVGDVMRQYKELEDDVSSIEAGLFPVPGYSTASPSSSSAFTLEWGGHGYGYEGVKQCYIGGGGRKSRPSEQERKKGIPWTEQEHKLFLMGLKKYGKGDWRNISRNFVITRTPTQVASHAQKYFIRQLSGGKDKRRASIHDITTVNLNEQEEEDHTKKQLPELPGSNQKHNHYPSFQGSHEAYNMFTPPPYGVNAYGLIKMHGHESFLGSQNMAFQMQSGLHYPS